MLLYGRTSGLVPNIVRYRRWDVGGKLDVNALIVTKLFLIILCNFTDFMHLFLLLIARF